MQQDFRTFFALGSKTLHVVRTIDGGWSTSLQGSSPECELCQLLQTRHANIHWFAFAEGSWFAAFTETSGKGAWQGDLKKHYSKLYNWLKSLKSFNAKETIVVLGPEGAFWARSKGNGQVSHNLPQNLRNELEKHRTTKQYVTLGLKDDFIYWNDKGYSTFTIKGYSDAFKWLDSHLKDGIQIVAATLSTFHEWERGAFFILLSDGSAYWVIPEELNAKAQDTMDGFRKKLSASRAPKLVAGGGTAAPIRPRAHW